MHIEGHDTESTSGVQSWDTTWIGRRPPAFRTWERGHWDQWKIIYGAESSDLDWSARRIVGRLWTIPKNKIQGLTNASGYGSRNVLRLLHVQETPQRKKIHFPSFVLHNENSICLIQSMRF